MDTTGQMSNNFQTNIYFGGPNIEWNNNSAN